MLLTLFILCGFVVVLALSFRSKPKIDHPVDSASMSEIIQSIRQIIDEEKNPPEQK